MVELAHSATHTKNTFLSKKYKSLVVRRGKKRSLIAIGHKILCCAYYILKDKVEYKDYDPMTHDKKKFENIKKYHLVKLESMGFDVQIKEKIA